MTQEQINYSDIIDLGFDTEQVDDKVYYNKYGFQYEIITFKINSKIYIDWSKETRLCQIVRVNKDQDIKNRKPIKNLEDLETIIDFFKNDNYKPAIYA